MKGKYKLILGLLLIFVLGIVTGISVTPFIHKQSTGNPYSIAVLSDRIYNISILDDVKLNDNQIELVNSLASKYVSKYTVERDIFIGKRRMLYSEFKFHLKEILTPQQFGEYKLKSDEIMKSRELYVKNLEKEWENERDSIKVQRLAKQDIPSFKSLFLDSSKNISSNISSNGYNNSQNNLSDYKLDFINRYLIDKIKNKWITYSTYEDVESNYYNLD